MKSKKIILSIIGVIAFLLFFHFTNEYDPAYRPYPTTFDGRPGYYGQLHRNGWYSFLDSNGIEIARMPSAEATKLH